jgi:hypothetical protein
LVDKLSIEQSFFNNFQQGLDWVQEANEMELNKNQPVDGTAS